MKIDFEEIQELFETGNLSEISRRTEIPLRTLENYKYGKSKNFEKMKDTFKKLQNFINQEENKMKLSINEVKELGALDQVGNNEKYYEFVNVKQGNKVLSYYNLFDSDLALTRRVKIDYTDKLKGLQRIAHKSDEKAMVLPYKQVELNDNYVILEELKNTLEGLESMAKSVQSEE